jgi:hypothetical protein
MVGTQIKLNFIDLETQIRPTFWVVFTFQKNVTMITVNTWEQTRRSPGVHIAPPPHC